MLRREALLSLFRFTESLSLTQQLHAQIIVSGLHHSSLFGSKLLNAHIELGSLHCAYETFNQIAGQNLRLWNTIISAHFKRNHWPEVLRLYKRMRAETNGVDSFNLVFAIEACRRLSLLPDGNSVHSLVIKSGFDTDPYVAPAVVNMYADLSCLENARKVFDEMPERNEVMWGTMMKSYLKFSKPLEVLRLFSDMKNAGSVTGAGSNYGLFTSQCLISACGNLSARREGKALHSHFIKRNFINHNLSLQTSLLDMYMKCGFLDLAVKLFEELPEKDVVLWTSMVAGFARVGRAQESIAIFRQMLKNSIPPNSFTISTLLQASSHTGSLQLGKSIHGYLTRNIIELDSTNHTSIIDMYTKCGSISSAKTIFRQIPKKNVFSWSSMINGYGIHGLYSESISCFEQMKSEGEQPNPVTFVSLLSACSHSGRVNEGKHYFSSMKNDYKIAPSEEHYACMVDLFGRAGKLEEAFSFIGKMPIQAGVSIWGALLSACRIHKRPELAEEVAKKLILLESFDSEIRVSLANVYAEVGMWDVVRRLRVGVGGEKGDHKSVGFAAVEIGRRLHFFSSKDRGLCSNTEIEGVWAILESFC